MGQITALLTQLGVNQTFFVMFALFAVTYFTVSALLTRPLGNLLVERDRRTAGRQEEISKYRVEVAEVSEKLGRERQKAQLEASQKFAELRNEAVSEQRKILADAREEFAAKVKSARDQVEKSLQDERQKLERFSNELKDEVVAKLLGSTNTQKISIGKEA